jgi:hypothetical protein
MDYTAMKERASALISRYSTLTISYSRVDTTGYTKQYNPATDAFVWYRNGSIVSEPTATTYSGTCLEVNTSDYFRAKGYVKESDRIFITNDIPKPLKNDVITVDGEKYTVYRVQTVNPGGTDILYRIYAKV